LRGTIKTGLKPKKSVSSKSRSQKKHVKRPSRVSLNGYAKMLKADKPNPRHVSKPLKNCKAKTHKSATKPKKSISRQDHVSAIR